LIITDKRVITIRLDAARGTAVKTSKVKTENTVDEIILEIFW